GFFIGGVRRRRGRRSSAAASRPAKAGSADPDVEQPPAVSTVVTDRSVETATPARVTTTVPGPGAAEELACTVTVTGLPDCTVGGSNTRVTPGGTDLVVAVSACG